MASPSVAINSVFITTAIQAAKGRDVAVVDLPGAHQIANMDNKEEVIIVLRTPLTDLMVLTAPEVYRKFIPINAFGYKLLYMKLHKSLYGLVKSVLTFYRKLWGNIHAK